MKAKPTKKRTTKKLIPKEVEPIPIKIPDKTLIKPVEEFAIRSDIKYEKHILKLLDMQGFYELWISRIPYTKTYESAYESAESFFIAHFEKRRFIGYECFRSSVSQWLKKKNAEAAK
jgi:hypothetical protein